MILTCVIYVAKVLLRMLITTTWKKTTHLLRTGDEAECEISKIAYGEKSFFLLY